MHVTREEAAALKRLDRDEYERDQMGCYSASSWPQKRMDELTAIRICLRTYKQNNFANQTISVETD